MNELNNREQEQYAEPTTKKSSRGYLHISLKYIALC